MLDSYVHNSHDSETGCCSVLNECIFRGYS